LLQPHGQHDADGDLLHESGKHHEQDAETPAQRPQLQRQLWEQSTPTSPRQLSVNSNLNPNLSSAPLFKESLKEYFLRNVNSEFVNDAPLLIEEKLKDLFSKFLCELSGTMETFPGTLLESCVMKLSSSIQEMITVEVIPALYDRVFKHINELFPLPPNRNEQLQEFFNDKLDSLQDIIIGLNSENSFSIESLKDNVASLEHSMSSTLRAMRVQMNKAEDRESSRFEQTKRRLGDFHSSINAMNQKLDLIVNNLQKNDSPPVIYNNPLMNDWPSQQAEPIRAQGDPPPPPPPPPSPPNEGIEPLQDSRKRPETNTGTAEVRADTPQWDKDFPFIKHNDVDPEMRKELWKSIPNTSEWDTFSGELPYNHELWLKNIDVFVEDYCMLDHMVISRLTALFTDTAKNWYTRHTWKEVLGLVEEYHP
jgi:hypothetical protein